MKEEKLFLHLGSIMKKIRRMMDKELYFLGITHTEMRLLMLIYNAEGTTQEEISSRIEIDRSNASRSLKKLENMDYIKRVKDEQDSRTYRILVTEKGWEIRKQIFEAKEKIRDRFVKGIDEEEVEILVALLEKIDRNLG
ncbi:MarR family transcriptional regulator [Thermosyntropha sp.]|uniref:MarR family winged helix-turn-helix transcriptional regulator n=1 Tax=Thermosyntropha sp. TaxID=2740820 RepID=UPI0025D103E3|nr:MarR family transcriptional regulator [Thermosyntropha sp.]MBO8159910.1 MarR family transcriptional regulator [Thermosyntropha sp.]